VPNPRTPAGTLWYVHRPAGPRGRRKDAWVWPEEPIFAWNRWQPWPAYLTSWLSPSGRFRPWFRLAGLLVPANAAGSRQIYFYAPARAVRAFEAGCPVEMVLDAVLEGVQNLRPWVGPLFVRLARAAPAPKEHPLWQS
jgi:hypothetical protein